MKLLFVTLPAAMLLYSYMDVSVYQVTTSIRGVRDLMTLPKDEIEACSIAYKYLMNGTAKSDTATETKHVRALYTVLHRLLAIADIEKLYIPPHIDSKKGLYVNQWIWEEELVKTLNVGSNHKVLDMGCGRGRIAHWVARVTGARISGYNIDESQVGEANKYAKETGLGDRLDFKQGDHHERLKYKDNEFDGAYSFQALWPFIKKHQLDGVAAEMFRVLKPGALYACGEYLLTPDFNHDDPEHMELHRLFLPTLAASQSNYPEDVTAALQRAGFEIILSAPSVAPAWPLCESKTDLFLMMRSFVIGLTRIGLMGPWAESILDDLLSGGQAWSKAEKMKIADLNWRITVRKPLNVEALK
jgi:sterol 24-C-methyltransferase